MSKLYCGRTAPADADTGDFFLHVTADGTATLHRLIAPATWTVIA